jgi:uncharacterized protein YodC (DUF2158 family)
MAEQRKRRTCDDNRAVAEQGIKVGDLVSLRTGGPTMSVQARSQNLAYCAWSKDGRFHYGTFDVASLRLVEDGGAARPAAADDGACCG